MTVKRWWQYQRMSKKEMREFLEQHVCCNYDANPFLNLSWWVCVYVGLFVIFQIAA